MKNDELSKTINADFKECVEGFHKQMDAHLNTYPLMISVLLANLKMSIKKRDKYVDKNKIEVVEKEDNSQVFRVEMPHHQNFQILQNQVEYSLLAIENLFRNTIVAMVGTYDAFVGNIIRLMFRAKPEMLRATGMSMEVAELFSYNDIKEVEACVIEKLVENVLRDSHAEQLSWLEKILAIKTLKEYDHFKDFIEITERRNLFVHTDGIISRSYLKKCRNVGIIVDAALGEKIEAKPEYIIRCHNVIMETGVKLSQVIWRKLNISIETCDESLQDVTFDCLNAGHYDLAQVLLKFATNDVKKYSNVDFEWVFRVNHALSYYLAGKKEQSNAIIREKKWSALDVRYRIAEAVILEKFSDAQKLMHKIGKDEEFQINYQQWPLFRIFRKSQEFNSSYEEIFGKPFVYEETNGSHVNEIIEENINNQE